MASGSDISVFPDEILSVVCQELGKDRDFNTLYQCARSARALADPALRMMYQYVDTPMARSS